MKSIFKNMLFGLRLRLDQRRADKARERKRTARVEEAIEHLVDGIDPKMRLIVGYKKKLLPSVDKALIYIDWLVDTIPGPIQCDNKAFATDPLVNAIFATASDLQKVFSQSEAVRTFFNDPLNVNVDECYALMCMEKDERAGFGMALEGEFVKKDVPQVAVNFFAHNIMAPAATAKEVRKCLKECIFDTVITNIFESVMANHLREAGTDEYRKVLDRRYKASQAWGQELTDLILSIRTDSISTNAAPAKVTIEQQASSGREVQQETPNDRLSRVVEILLHPENVVRLNHISMNLTRMGIKVTDNSGQSFNRIEFTEIEIKSVWRRIIVLVRYPRNEMLTNHDLF